MKKKALLIALVLAGVMFLAGCSGKKEAKQTTSALSLRYGVGHYNGFRKTIIAVSSDLSMVYHVYPAETLDDEMNYDGIQRLGPATPMIEISSTISSDHWDALITSQSLRGVWRDSKDIGMAEELCGTEALILTLRTPTAFKTVGGYVIDDRWLYETSQILEQLARNNGTLQQGEDKLNEYLAQAREEDEKEPK